MLVRVLQKKSPVCVCVSVCVCVCVCMEGRRYLIQELSYIVIVTEVCLSPASWRTREGLGVTQSETKGPRTRSTKV